MNKSVIPIVVILLALATYISKESTQSVQNKYDEPAPINAIESQIVHKRAALTRKAPTALKENKEANHILMAALADEREDLVIEALNKGANPNIIFNNRRFTMAMDKSLNCNPTVLKALIDAGADLKIKDTHGRSALDYAKRNGNEDCIKILNDSGAI
ncbi:ankyrin repeat domain-containing protein [Halobacteriovorax sp. DA5]|uniref:ankyrin repeat domain-containing protein n=1 Tax=Halobacteriovorax sp. DA5 TaxID=2067553 RepID=UPI000CD317C3|nr:ankyrin repeat domain-containing protein [Halobacteriovorax sp. DA5]POB14288.1 hypothetical protein C0Z22_04150 [Halobacteriovorax sp. DA5]